MEDEFSLFDGESAVNIVSDRFVSFRAVEVVSSDLFLLSAPAVHRKEVHVTEQSIVVAESRLTTKEERSGREKPLLLNGKNCVFTRATFNSIRKTVETALDLLQDYDWSFIPSDYSWKCKYFLGSNVREMNLACFWDSVREEHIIEVKRISGDCLALGSSAAEIVDRLRKVFEPDSVETTEKKPSKGGRLRGPLPLPVAMKSSSSHNNKEQFLQGVESIVKMSSTNLESRLEAARMLCDLAENTEKSLLLLPECQDLCFQTLDLLFHDNEERSEEIKQFALMAFGMLSEHDSYQECFLHFKDFDEIIRCIENSPVNKPSCDCIQMRRQAAKGLSLLVAKASNTAKYQSAKLSLLKQLQTYGFLDLHEWESHCNQLRDARLRSFALKISPCFH